MHPRVQQFHTGNSFLKIQLFITIFFSVWLGIRATLESYLKALSHLCSFVKAQGCSRYRDGLSVPDRARDYTITRFKPLASPAGNSNNYQPCTPGMWDWCGGTGRLDAEEGAVRLLDVVQIKPPSLMPVCHIEINGAHQANLLQNIRCLKGTVKKHCMRRAIDYFVSCDWLKNILLISSFCFVLHPWPRHRSLMLLKV